MRPKVRQPAPVRLRPTHPQETFRGVPYTQAFQLHASTERKNVASRRHDAHIFISVQLASAALLLPHTSRPLPCVACSSAQSVRRPFSCTHALAHMASPRPAPAVMLLLLLLQRGVGDAPPRRGTAPAGPLGARGAPSAQHHALPRHTDTTTTKILAWYSDRSSTLLGKARGRTSPAIIIMIIIIIIRTPMSTATTLRRPATCWLGTRLWGACGDHREIAKRPGLSAVMKSRAHKYASGTTCIALFGSRSRYLMKGFYLAAAPRCMPPPAPHAAAHTGATGPGRLRTAVLALCGGGS